MLYSQKLWGCYTHVVARFLPCSPLLYTSPLLSLFHLIACPSSSNFHQKPQSRHTAKRRKRNNENSFGFNTFFFFLFFSFLCFFYYFLLLFLFPLLLLLLFLFIDSRDEKGELYRALNTTSVR